MEQNANLSGTLFSSTYCSAVTSSRPGESTYSAGSRGRTSVNPADPSKHALPAALKMMFLSHSCNDARLTVTCS